MSGEGESITFTADRDGAHVHITVRAGVEGQRALCGNLTMRVPEWELLRAILAPGSTDERIVIGHAGDGAERILKSVVAAHRAAQTSEYVGTCYIHDPKAEIVEYAIANAKQRTVGSTYLDVHLDGAEITIYGIPAGAMAAVPPPPLPACFRCGSTAAPNECPCGHRRAIPTSTSAPVDDMPF